MFRVESEVHMSTPNQLNEPNNEGGTENTRTFIGGIIRERSNCCSAPLRELEGIGIKVCSQCEQPNPERNITTSI